MKVRFNRWYNAVLTALLSMLGYSCSSDDIVDEYGVPVEYGVPTAHFIMKGTVTDEAGTPIQGIKATLKVMPTFHCTIYPRLYLECFQFLFLFH